MTMSTSTCFIISSGNALVPAAGAVVWIALAVEPRRRRGLRVPDDRRARGRVAGRALERPVLSSSTSSSSSAAAASPRHGLRPEREGRCSPPGPAGGTALQPGHGHGWLCLIHDAAAAELHLALPGHSALHMRMQMSGIPAFAGRGHRPLRTTAHNLQGGEGGAVFCLTSRLKHNDIRRQNEVDQLQCSLR